MSINKTYAVFGLGRYGKAVAEELVKNGAEVLGVDIDQDIVDNAVETIPVCKCADITEAEVIKRLGIFNMDIGHFANTSYIEIFVVRACIHFFFFVSLKLLQRQLGFVITLA